MDDKLGSDEVESKRILMFSHSITGVTGFGNVTRRVAMYLSELGHEIYAVHRGYHGFPCHIEELGDIQVLPIGAHEWGEDILPYYMQEYRPDIVWTLLDIWCGQNIANYPKNKDWKWIRYFPFDTENVVGFWRDYLNATDLPVAMARFAEELMEQQGIFGKYIPHGVDTKTFRPASSKERADLRSQIELTKLVNETQIAPAGRGIPENDFVVTCVAHNQMRKNIDRLLEAFTMFSRNKPDTKLILHMQPKDQNGWDLPMIISDLKLKEKVLFTNLNAKMIGDIFVSEEDLRNLYCLGDVHCLLTGGEGFGLPFVEAMACGIPNIGTAWTTPKEFFADIEEKEIEHDDGRKETTKVLVEKRGLLIKPAAVQFHRTGGSWAIADTGHAANALQFLYDNKDKGKELGDAARKFAVEKYDWDKVVLPQWNDLINNLDSIMEKKYQSPQRGGLKLVGL